MSAADGQCYAAKSFVEAGGICAKMNAHVCSVSEVMSNSQCDNGCEFDYDAVWTSTKCSKDSGEEDLPVQTLTQVAHLQCDAGGLLLQERPVSEQVECCRTRNVRELEFCCRMHQIGCDGPLARVGLLGQRWSSREASVVVTVLSLGAAALILLRYLLREAVLRRHCWKSAGWNRRLMYCAQETEVEESGMGEEDVHLAGLFAFAHIH